MKLPKNLNYLRPLKTGALFRIGDKGDGGYIVPRSSFKNINCIISFGLGDNFSFEEHARKLNRKLNIVIYDHTINFSFFFFKIYKSIKRIFYFKSNFFNIYNKISILIRYFFLKKKYIVHIKKKITNNPKNANEVNPGLIFSEYNKKKILLKVDIEGDEYKILSFLENYKNLIHILIIEFHNIDKKRIIFKKNVIFIKNFFNIVHIHGNNSAPLCRDGLPSVLELTFVNKKIYKLNKKKYLSNFPLKNLDFPNFNLKKDFFLNFN